MQTSYNRAYREVLEKGEGSFMELLVREIEAKSILSRSNLPIGGYSANPYIGCPHACKYCYASFMKRFTNHSEPWGSFVDIKYWPDIKNTQRYAGKELFIGSVTKCRQGSMKAQSKVKPAC